MSVYICFLANENGTTTIRITQNFPDVAADEVWEVSGLAQFLNQLHPPNNTMSRAEATKWLVSQRNPNLTFRYVPVTTEDVEIPNPD